MLAELWKRCNGKAGKNSKRVQGESRERLGVNQRNVMSSWSDDIIEAGVKTLMIFESFLTDVPNHRTTSTLRNTP